MSTNFHDFQQPDLNTLTTNQRNNLLDNVKRHVEWLKKTKKDANQRLSRIHHDLNQLDDSRYPSNEALREAKEEKMRLANQIEAGLTFFEEQYNLWNEYYNTIKERALHPSGGRISPEEEEKEEKDIYNAVFRADLQRDIREIRKLLDEAAEELFLGDLPTARKDLKKVTEIMEAYNSLAWNREIAFRFPREVLNEYEDLMEQLTNMELGTSQHRSRNNSFSSGNDIQFNDADWEFSGAGFSREREHLSNIRKIGGRVDFKRDKDNMEQQEYEREREARDEARRQERRRQEARRIRAENERRINERFHESIENDEMLNEDTRRIDIWRRSGRSGHQRALDRLGMRNEDVRGLDRIERWREQQRHR
jgi:hypothetical protein